MIAERKKLIGADTTRRFALAGNATLTVVSLKTQERFTFKVTKAQGASRSPSGEVPWFVKVLTGPDNETSYTYLGTLWATRYVHAHKSHIAHDAPSAKAATWFFTQLLTSGAKLDQVEVWHEGRCGRCGRKLTVPESVSMGIGPECASQMATLGQLQLGMAS